MTRITMKHGGKSAAEIVTLLTEVADIEITAVTFDGELAHVSYREIPQGYAGGADFEGWECAMCGKERVLNEEGYCSQCWTIWKS